MSLLMSFIATLQGSLELGIIYAIMALGVFISFRTLNIPDLTVDSSFTLGAAVSAVLTVNCSQPFLGLALAFLAGCAAGLCTSLLTTKLKIQPLLSGILMMLALYSINLKVMGKPNIPLLNETVMFSFLQGVPYEKYMMLAFLILILAIVIILLFFFLKTKLGLALRATGDNDRMVRALGVNTDTMIIIGLALSNGLVALTGAIIAQYQSFSDISMGIGMVVIGLASVIVGEVIFSVKTLAQRLIAVALGAILYRLVIAFALWLGMPPTDMKLISAIILIIALSMNTIKDKLASMKSRRANSGRKGGECDAQG